MAEEAALLGGEGLDTGALGGELGLDPQLLTGGIPDLGSLAGGALSPEQLETLQKAQEIKKAVPETTGQRIGSAFLDIIIIATLGIIGFIAAILLAISAGAIPKISAQWRSDPDLSRAHRLMSWATALLWVGGFLLIGFYIIFSWLLVIAYNYIFALIQLAISILFFVSAILAFIAVGDIKKSPLFDSTNKDAKRAVDTGLAAAILAMISSVGLAIWLIYSFIQFEKEGGVKADIKAKEKEAEAVGRVAFLAA